MKTNHTIALACTLATTLILAGCSQQAAAPTSTQPVAQTTTQAPAITTPVVATTDSTLKIENLSFTLPTNWTLKSIEDKSNKAGKWQVATIKVPDPKYEVSIAMSVVPSADNKITAADKLLQTTPSGAKIYDNGCAPAIACYYLSYNNAVYDIHFAEPESTEPAPANLDGPWFPSTTVTEKDTLDFLATVTSTTPSTQAPAATTDSTLSLQDLSFAMPTDWTLDKKVKDKDAARGYSTHTETAYVKIPNQKYDATLVITVAKHDAKFKLISDEKLISTTPTGAKIYQAGCDGILGCYDFENKGTFYGIAFQVESNEPAPKPDINDPFWQPSIDLSNTTSPLGFLATVK